ncbi:SLATT domain-containing protein [Pseudomonas sp. Eqa60]|uniref:SLATT domain-containing protein n=1 Tax=Pseudomonas sp. Eqa60 TaxID=2799184 RepID=UPI001BB40C85|nr:SLATT domain-containing protein [Pseudomonas sp. Eqa60]
MSTHELTDNDTQYALVAAEMERHREDTETSKLGHWAAAATYERRHKVYLGFPATLGSLLLTWLLSSDVKKIFEGSGHDWIIGMVPVGLSLVVSLLTGAGAFLNFSEMAIKHRSAAESLHALWRDCLNWKTDFPNSTKAAEAVLAVQRYRQRLNDINRDAPQIPYWAYKKGNRQKAQGSTRYTEKNSAVNKVPETFVE